MASLTSGAARGPIKASTVAGWFYAYNKILEAKLPRTANEMYHYHRATIVANNDLRRGDLLFFHIHSREIADHMGVYLGDGQFIESPRTGETIRISRLAEPFWQDHFWARAGF